MKRHIDYEAPFISREKKNASRDTRWKDCLHACNNLQLLPSLVSVGIKLTFLIFLWKAEPKLIKRLSVFAEVRFINRLPETDQ